MILSVCLLHFHLQGQLHVAATHGHASVVQFLLDVCGESGIVDSVDQVPRLRCVLLQTLLTCVCEQDGLTALHLAARYGHLQVASLLISAGANVDVLAPVRPTLSLPMVPLYETSNHLPLCLQDGNSVLHTACFNGCDDIVRLLLPDVDTLEHVNEVL